MCADAKQALEATHTAALATCVSQHDSQRTRAIHQTELADLNGQQEQQAEHLRVKWLLELKMWDDSVSMFSDHLNHKIPDARWLSELLRKGHCAQSCYDTALEFESFLTKWCADPNQELPWLVPLERDLQIQETYGGWEEGCMGKLMTAKNT